MSVKQNTVRLLVCGVLLLLGVYVFAPRENSLVIALVPTPEVSADTSGDVSEPSAPVDRDDYRVTKVVDGDTIRVLRDGVEETVRLIGIDTPETIDPRKPVQCFGKEASARTLSMLGGKEVRLLGDDSQDVRDKYGRLLAYVYLPDGTLVNQELILEGYAHEYTYRVPYKFQVAFKESERNARAMGAGLWADGACGLSSSTSSSVSPPPEESAPMPATSAYRCDVNAYNCTDFQSQAEAELVFFACGGPSSDIHHLDVDKDGIVCEGLK